MSFAANRSDTRGLQAIADHHIAGRDSSGSLTLLPGALPYLERARQLRPDSAVAPHSLAVLYDSLGRRREAKDLYEASLKINGQNAFALNNLASYILDSSGDLDQALTYAQRARQQNPARLEIADTVGQIYLKKGLVDNAIEIFQDLVRKNPKESQYHYHLGIALLRKGETTKAKVELETAAVGELTGSRTNLTGGGFDTVQFNSTTTDHFTLSWVITNPVAGTWDYSYTFSGTPNGSGKGVSHFIMSTANSCIAGSGDPNCIKNITISGGASVVLVPGTYGPSPSDPNFPVGASFTGEKFNVTGGPALPVTVTFTSDRAPVYGDFYLKVATSTTAYNNGLGNETTSTLLSDFIAMPGDLTPEPGTAVPMLAGVALVGLAKYLGFRIRT